VEIYLLVRVEDEVGRLQLEDFADELEIADGAHE